MKVKSSGGVHSNQQVDQHFSYHNTLTPTLLGSFYCAPKDFVFCISGALKLEKLGHGRSWLRNEQLQSATVMELEMNLVKRSAFVNLRHVSLKIS
jgi:hypothetical protein